jgi:DNA-binding HxlR family transcriptional regulator
MPADPQWDIYDPDCPSRTVLDLIGGRWTVVVIGALADGPLRFGQLQRRAGGVSPKVLTQVLRALARDSLITRTIYPEVPPHTEYQLTGLGTQLITPLNALGDWAESNIESILASRQMHDRARYAGSHR